MNLRLACVLLALTSSCVMSSAQPHAVRVERQGERWVLLRDDQPYFVKGGGGTGNPTLLAQLGGNSIRTWGAPDLEPRDWPDGTHRSLLDVAEEHGLTVCAGFWVQHPRHGFDYDDEAAVKAQLDEARAFAEKWKDHPALLMWGVGNEVTHETDPVRPLREVNRVAQVFKEVDPNHPTMTAIPGVWNGLAAHVAQNCPDIDVLGVNAYGGLHAVPQELLRQGYDGPYVVTEFGPIGHWETAVTPWGAPVEQSSAGKARSYRELYNLAVKSQPDRCLGAYAFLWGQKQERTSTWYGLLLDTGERTPATDVMSYLWTGSWPAHRVPLVDGIECDAALSTINPGTEHNARVVMDDGSSEVSGLTVEWKLLRESTATSSGGDPESRPAELQGMITSAGPGAVRLRAPDRPGAYRLFVFVRDAHGGAGTANFPFRVRAE